MSGGGTVIIQPGPADGKDALIRWNTPNYNYETGTYFGTGKWNDLGLTANPAAGGAVLVIVVGPDRKIYCGGSFTNMDGAVGRNNIARYVPSTDTWETVGAGAAVNGLIQDMMFGPDDDTLYIVGAFTNVGDANGDYFAKYNISTNAWTSVSGGGTANGYAIDIGLDGTIYIGGNFVNWNGIANADGIVSWNGAAYAAMGTGMTGGSGLVQTIKVAADGQVYAGGNFTTAGGVAAANIAVWDGTSWSALSTGTAGITPTVWDIEQDSDRLIYISGNFTTAGGITVNRIASWNGFVFSSLGDGGSNNSINTMRFAPDGLLWVVGTQPTVGALVDSKYIAKWNGINWLYTDIDFGTITGGDGLDISAADPVIMNNYDVYIGLNASAAETFAGSTTVNNAGTAPAHVEFIVTRSGGTSARLKTLRNETTGKELVFDYALLDGETLTVNLVPTETSIISSLFGSRFDAILSGSDAGSWILQPGDNNVTCFVDVAGAPTVTAWLEWRTASKGAD